MIDRLRKRKLVTIQVSPKDRRRSMITLTDNGRRVVREEIVLAHRITAETLASLKPPEQREVVRLLQKMI